MPDNDTSLNANTSCGLEEALRRGALQVLASDAGTGVTAHMEGVLPSSTGGIGASWNQSLQVNVLVTLVGPGGKRLAAQCYDPYQLNPAEAARLLSRATRAP